MLASAEVAAAQAAAAGCPFNFTTLTDSDGAYSLTVPYALSLHMATATLSYERAGFVSETRAVSLDATILAADAARYAWVEGTRHLAGARPNASSSVECVSSRVGRVMIVVCCVALCCVVLCGVVLLGGVELGVSPRSSVPLVFVLPSRRDVYVFGGALDVGACM